MVGPWTLAAAIELRTGERALRDPPAVADLADALGEALRLHVADLRRRLPRATAIVVQIDEPSLPAVLEGRIGTASGLSSYRAVDAQDAERVLRQPMAAVRDVGALPGVHCCHPDVPMDLLRRAGAGFLSVDLIALADGQDDALGRAWESGTGIVAGCVPSVGDSAPGATRASAPLRDLLHRLGLEDPRWLEQTVITPACGLAGASPQWVRAALAACVRVGRVVRDDGQNEEEPDDEGARR